MGRDSPLSKPTRSRWMLLAAMAMGVVIVAYSGSRLRVSYKTPLTGCARDHGTGGASGVFRWADRIGIPVRLLEDPIWEAPRSFREPSGNCVLMMGNGPWSPTGEEMDGVNWLTTGDWLARGNALIVVTTELKSLPKSLREDLNLSRLHENDAEHDSFLFQDSVDNRPETSRAPVKGGGIMTVETKGPRWSADPPKEPAPGKPATSPSRPAEAVDPSRWQLAADATGGVLFRIPAGKGAVYILLDEFAWTNTGLDQGDNARVLAGILGREIRGGVLAIDEYRHGHGRTESFLTYLLNLPGSSAIMWLAAIWGLLYFYGRNVRLRPVEAYVERERRTAQESINAVAQLYERARAAPLVVEAVARRLRQIARSSAEPPPNVEKLLRDAEIYAQAQERPSSPTTAIRLVNELIQLRKRIYGTRTVS
jgi:hypothetical protein